VRRDDQVHAARSPLDRHAGELGCGFDAHEWEVLAGVGKLNSAKALERDKVLVSKIREELSKGGGACSGLRLVLDALMEGLESIAALLRFKVG